MYFSYKIPLMASSSVQPSCPPQNVPAILINDQTAAAAEQSENVLYTTMDLDEELDEILDELDDPEVPMRPEEKDAIMEYADTKKKRKFLFDGQNMIRISPKRTAKMKAMLGKTLWLSKKISKTVSSVKLAVIEKAVGVFSGNLVDYIPKTGQPIPPLIYHSIKEIESREPITRAWLYKTPARNRHINKVKRRFMRGNFPNVRKEVMNLVSLFIVVNCKFCFQLSKYDIHVPAQAIMSFLSDLKEPLVPRTLVDAFNNSNTDASCKISQVEQMKGLIARLPEANRVTLKFILRHLQEMAKCRYAKLSMGSSAVLFAPILMGASKCADPQELEMLGESLFVMLKIDAEFLEDETSCPM